MQSAQHPGDQQFDQSDLTQSEEYEDGHIDVSEPVKHNYKTHRSGNTFRLTGSKISGYRSSSFELETDHRAHIHIEDSHVVIPVTDVDTTFPELLKSIQSGCTPGRSLFGFSYGSVSFSSLNHDSMWEIQEILEKKSIKTSHSAHNAHGVMERSTIYQLPVTGLIQMKIKGDFTQSTENRNTFEWNSQVYLRDPDIIYTVSGNRLQVAIAYNYASMPTNISKIKFSVSSSQQSSECNTKSAIIMNNREWDPVTKSLVKITDIRHGFSSFRSWFYNNYENAYWQPVTSTKSSDCVILDMGKNTRIKYISTMGRPPKTRLYPSRGENPTNSNLHKNPITIFDSQAKEFVTKYALYGRMESGQWIHIGNYSGNSDCVTEVAHNISTDMAENFSPRYLKIVPISYFGAKSMRFMLYGDASDNEPMEEETTKYITYTLNHKNDDTFHREGAVGRGCRCDWCMHRDQGVERLSVKQMCRDLTNQYNADPVDFMESGY